MGVIVMVDVIELPLLTLPLVCARLILKSGGAAVTVTLTGEETEAL
jgi:hypothetical protein